MKRIVTLSQPRVIPVNPDVKMNPFKVAKTATRPLAHRRIRHIEELCKSPKRKMVVASKNKKKLGKPFLESSKRVIRN